MKPIRSDDKNALELLKQKAEMLRAEQERMKAANKHFRDNNTMKGFEGISDEKAAAIDKSIWESRDKKPHHSYELQNNNQNLRETEKRIKALERENAAANETHEYNTSKYGFEVEENKEDMRLRLLFDGKPSEEIRSKLKSNGFKWSPTNEAWQRLLNDSARYSLKRFISFMEQQQKSGGMEM